MKGTFVSVIGFFGPPDAQPDEIVIDRFGIRSRAAWHGAAGGGNPAGLAPEPT
jgi:hypothetical protein